jgi:hypothetical protein
VGLAAFVKKGDCKKMSKITPGFTMVTYTDWENVRGVFKGGSTTWYRFSRLEPVNKALKLYFKGPSLRRRLAVDDAIHRIRSKSRAAYMKYEELLTWLAVEMERRNPHRVGFTGGTGQFGKTVTTKLNEMAHYAVTDLPTYPGNIRPGHVGRVWNRYHLMTDAELSHEGKASTRVCVKFDKGAIRSASQFTHAGRCGCCTTFAARAADIIMRAYPNTRVEVVAVPTAGTTAHCFVIAGRNGEAANGRLPQPSYEVWGQNFCVVDPWLAALGFDCVYPRGVNFPVNWLSGTFSGQTGNGLEQKFDSQAPETDTDTFKNQLFGALRKAPPLKEKTGVPVGRVR